MTTLATAPGTTASGNWTVKSFVFLTAAGVFWTFFFFCSVGALLIPPLVFARTPRVPQRSPGLGKSRSSDPRFPAFRPLGDPVAAGSAVGVSSPVSSVANSNLQPIRRHKIRPVGISLQGLYSMCRRLLDQMDARVDPINRRYLGVLRTGSTACRLAHIRCRNVFVCTNVYTGNLHPYLRGLVRPVRGQMIMTTPLDPMIGVAGISDWYYFRQLPDGCVLVGGARRFYEEQEFTAEDVVTGNLQSNLEGFVRSWFPGTQFDIQRRWAGIHGFTPDRRVAVGLIPNEPRIAFALGFSGYGNSIGLVSAERMVELALDGVDPGPLSATRFS